MKWKENKVLANRNKWLISLWKHTRFLFLRQLCPPFQHKISFNFLQMYFFYSLCFAVTPHWTKFLSYSLGIANYPLNSLRLGAYFVILCTSEVSELQGFSNFVSTIWKWICSKYHMHASPLKYIIFSTTILGYVYACLIYQDIAAQIFAV